MTRAIRFIFTIGSIVLMNLSYAQQDIPEIEQYEIRNYDPQKSGLADLVFEARIENLVELLNKAGTFGKLSDVYFKIHWLSPDQYQVEVHGLPKGFAEVRNDLAMLIKGKLEFIIPEKFSSKFKAYTLKAEPISDGKLIKAIDQSYTMAVPEVEIVFDKSGKLKTVSSKANFQSINTEFFQSPKAWSNNKLVFDKIVTVTQQAGVTVTTTNSIDYITVAGIGFPSKITVSNVTEARIPAQGKEKEKDLKEEIGSVILFSNYEVNTGKAQRFMVEKLKR